MIKKLFGTTLTVTMCLLMAACTKANNVPTESLTTEIITETIETEETTEEDIKTVEDFNNAISEQFSSLSTNDACFTINAYLSTEKCSFGSADWIMTLAHSKDTIHINDKSYVDAWLYDNLIYYYDKEQKQWFKSEYTTNGTEDEVVQTFNEIKDQVFPLDAKIYKAIVNDIEYDAVEYIDETGLTSIYYFKDMKLISASSQDEANNYIFITIDLNEFNIPEEILNSEEGNYEEYMINLYANENSNNNENTEENIEEDK